MEQSSSVWLESEIECAEILAHLHHTFSLFSSVPYSWVCRKKRSAIQNKPSSHCGGATTTVNAVKAKVSSPITPLSFPATESDEKPKHSEKTTSLKRKKKKEHYLSIIEDLKKTKDSTTQEIANVKRHCEELKVFNSKLKAKQKELNVNGPKGDYKNPNLEINEPMKVNDIIKNSVNTPNSTTEKVEQKKQKMQMPNSTRSLGVASSSTSSMGQNSGNVGRLSIPDLNISFEAIKDLSKIREAQARQRRIQILRHKRNNAKQHH